MARYCKPWLSIEDQVQKLADRGLVISNVSQAEEHISRIGYYRLTGYLHPFRQRDTSVGGSGGLLSSYGAVAKLGGEPRRPSFSFPDGRCVPAFSGRLEDPVDDHRVRIGVPISKHRALTFP